MPSAYPDIYITYLRNFTAAVSMGIHDAERRAPQKLVISAALILAKPRRFKDEIASVQDYDFLRDGLHSMIARGHYDLQETFCTEVLELCLAQAGVLGAIVRTEKPAVYADSDGVGCRMAAFKDESLQQFPWWQVDV